MEKDRIIHSLSVANKMVEIGKKFNLSINDLEALFIIGINHDIGYRFGNSENYNKIGGNILKNNNFKYWKEIYYHGEINSEYESLYLDILNMSDMQIDKFGNDVGYNKRIEDISNRYGANSVVVKKCKIMIENLKSKYKNC